MKIRIILTFFAVFISFIIIDSTIFRKANTQSYNKSIHKEKLTSFNLAPLSLGHPETVKKSLRITTPKVPVLEALPAKPPKAITQVFKGEKGDTLAEVLARAGVSSKDTHNLVVALKKNFDPRMFGLNQKIKVFFKPEASEKNATNASLGRFLGIHLEQNLETIIQVTKDEKGKFKADKVSRKLKTILSQAEGKISSSLYAAGKKAGLSNSILAELIRIYSWDIDFQRDIRRNDTFEVFFNKILNEDGDPTREGKILYASLTLSNRPHLMYLFKNAHGHEEYFDEEGKSAKKALMRTPIDGAKLSSGFGRRKHPILGFTRMHKGLDFSAQKGTPIFAAGSGKISFSGWKGAYGRFIKIRHTAMYSSAYAHMSKFASKIKRGYRVKQGDVIGYVGTSGRSTGPHLHYEIRKFGRQVNPLRIKMPSGKKLSGREKRLFKASIKKINQEYKKLRLEMPVFISKQ